MKKNCILTANSTKNREYYVFMYVRKHPKLKSRIVRFSANSTKIPPFCVFVLNVVFTGGFWRINSTNQEGFIGNKLVLKVLYIFMNKDDYLPIN